MAQPVMPIQAKKMPAPPKGQKKSTVKTVSSVAASDSSASASRPAESSARDERRKPVKGSAAKREASTQAKELVKDADAAKKFLTKFKQETDEIEWYQRPEGPQCCKNFDTCQADNAMFWCHPCGLNLHIAFSAVFAVRRVNITSSITLRKFPQNLCLTALAR